MMKSWRALVLILITCGCGSVTRSTFPTSTAPEEETSARVKAFFEEYFDGYLQFDPLLATQIGERSYNDQLAVDISETYRAQLGHFYRRYLEKLSRLDTAGIDESDRMSCMMLRYDLTTALEGLKYPSHLMPIDQLGSLAVRFPLLGSGADVHRFETPEDYDDFVSRVYGFKVWVDTAISNMRRGMAVGIVQARPVIERTLPQLEAVIVDDPTRSIFYTPITRMPSNFSDRQRRRIVDIYTRMIAGDIVPTYRKLVTFLKEEYLPACRDQVGLSSLPDGEAWYRYLVRYYTTTDLPTDTIFARGMAEAERIQTARQSVYNRAGATNDFEFRQAIKGRYLSYGTRDSLIGAYNALKNRVGRSLTLLFGRSPRADFEIRPVEEFREGSFPSHYLPPSADGSRPGIFYVNMAGIESAPQPAVESLFLHEALPGHHFQLGLQAEQTSLPKFRRFGYYGAFIEGWGLYAETLGQDLGLYNEIFQHYLRLGAELGRAKRLVVDIGIHLKGWSRAEAIDYLVRSGGTGRAAAEQEVDRYIAMPGQALSYKVGQLEIVELRTRAQRALGEHFNLRDFHDELLNEGALPLGLLEQKIELWIERQTESD